MPNPSTAAVGFSKLRRNLATGRYYIPKSEGGDGKFWSEATVRGIVDRDIQSRNGRMERLGQKAERLGQKFKDGAINREQLHAGLDVIEAQHAKEITAVHLTKVAEASGGFHNMDAKSWGRAGGFTAYHRGKSREMFQEFRDNPDILTGDASGKMKPSQRLPQYSEAGRYSFERTADLVQADVGLIYVENVLEPSAHNCAGVGSCPEQTDLGRIRYDDPRRSCPGGRKCRTKCKCGTRRFKVAA